jgi:hypothetical protein
MRVQKVVLQRAEEMLPAMKESMMSALCSCAQERDLLSWQFTWLKEPNIFRQDCVSFHNPSGEFLRHQCRHNSLIYYVGEWSIQGRPFRMHVCMRNAYKDFYRISKNRDHFGGPLCNWKDTLMTHLNKQFCGCLDWICLAPGYRAMRSMCVCRNEFLSTIKNTYFCSTIVTISSSGSSLWHEFYSI